MRPDVISPPPGKPERPTRSTAPLGLLVHRSQLVPWARPPSGLGMSTVSGSPSVLEAGHPHDVAWPQSSAPRCSHSGPCLAEPIRCSVGSWPRGLLRARVGESAVGSGAHGKQLSHCKEVCQSVRSKPF